MNELEKLAEMLNRGWVIQLSKQITSWDGLAATSGWEFKGGNTICCFGYSKSLGSLLLTLEPMLAEKEYKWRAQVLATESDLPGEAIKRHMDAMAEMRAIIDRAPAVPEVSHE